MKNITAHISRFIGWFILAALLAIFIAPDFAQAKRRRGKGKRRRRARASNVLVVKFDKRSKAYEKTVSAVTKKKKYPIASAKRVKKAAKRARARLRNRKGYSKAAEKLGATAFIEVKSKKKRKRNIVVFTVLRPADAQVVGTLQFKGKKVKGVNNQLKAKLWKKLRPLLRKAATAPVAVVDDPEPTPESAPTKLEPRNDEPTPEEVPEEEEEDEEEEELPNFDEDEEPASDDEEPSSDEGEAYQPNRIDAAVGVNLFSRQYNYNDDISTTLRPYDLPLATAVAADLIIYPAAFFSKGFAANIGLEVSTQYALGLSSSTRDGGDFPTSSFTLRLGPHVRIPIKSMRSTEIYVSANYGIHSFTIDDNGAVAKPPIPSVDYSFLRFGAGARLHIISRVAIIVGLAYRLVLGSGEIESNDFFPRLAVGGLDAELGVAIPIVAGFEARVIGNLRRYFYTFNPEVGDTFIAGGATDDYFGAKIQAAYRF